MSWPVIEVEIKWNLDNFKRIWNEAKILARDTKKELDKSLLVNLEINVATLQKKLEDARSKLRLAKKDLDKEAEITLRIETNKLTRDLTEAKRQLNNYVNTGDKDLSRLQAKFDWIKDSIIWVATLIKTALVTWFWLAIKSVVSLWANLEQTEVAFTTMLWSAEKAKILLQDLTEFALKTPFQITWIRDTAKQLLAMWVDIENLLPTMKMLWDVSAWLSVPLERLALAYGQVLAKWRLQWWELKQFTEAWVPLIETLSAQLNVSSSEFYKLVEAWQITAADVTKAFETMTSEWWKFEDLMIKQSETLAWKWSNFVDTLTKIWETLWTEFLPLLKNAVDNVLWLVETYASSVSTILVDTINILTEIVWWFTNSVNTLFNELNSDTEKAWEIQLSFWQRVLLIFSNILAWIQGVILAFKSLGAYLATNLLNNTKRLSLFGWVIADFWRETLKVFKVVWNNIWNAFLWWIDLAIWGINKMIELINNIPWVNIWKIWTLGTWWFNFQEIDWKSPLEWFAEKSAKINDEISSNWTDLTSMVLSDWDKMAENIDKRNKTILDSTKKTISDTWKEIKKIDYSKILSSVPTEKDKWWWSAESKAKKEAEKILNIKTKALEDEAKKNIEVIQRSELKEKEKAEAIIAINKKLQQDILALKWDVLKLEEQNAQDIIKIEKEKETERKKVVDSFYDSIDKWLKESTSKVEAYQKKIDSLQDSFENLKNEATKDIKEINADLEDLELETQNKVAERQLEILEEQKKVQNEINELKSEWISQSLAESLWKETLESMKAWWVKDINWQSIDNLLSIIELLKTQRDLEKELTIAKENTNEKTFNEIKRIKELTETERILEEQRKSKAVLEERKKIDQAILDWTEINLEEIKNRENIAYAEWLIAKQTSIQNELALVQEWLNQEKKLVKQMVADKMEIEKEYSMFFKWEINKRIDDIKRLAQEMKNARIESQALQSGQVINTNNNTNVWGINVYNQTDWESAFNKLMP